MWVLRRRRGRNRDVEIRCRLHDLLYVIIYNHLRGEFLRTREGGCARTATVGAHYGENEPLVHQRFDRHHVDLLVQLENESRSLAITYLRSSHKVQGASKVLQDALHQLDLAVRYYGILVDSRILDVPVSIDAFWISL